MKLPVGYDDFGNVMEKRLDYVDKTLFIKEIIDDRETLVAVITRPRRFGKTLNLSMLHHFLAAEVRGAKTKELFDKFKIAKIEDGKYLEYQGQYPVIFLTLKGIEGNNFQAAYANFAKLIRDLYLNHESILSSSKVGTLDKNLFTKIAENKAEPSELVTALKDLCKYLCLHYGKKVWLLIDEYDSPVHAAYEHNYYPEMIDFMRGFLGAALKTNPYLDKAVITGILRISKESIFSQVNNVEIYSILQNRYSEYFGFTEDEVKNLLKQANLESKAEAIKDWYNGYIFGETTVYNPWSIVHTVNKGILAPYWVNTSGNVLIKDLILSFCSNIEGDLEKLLRGEKIKCFIDEQIVFNDIKNDAGAIWNLFAMSGYLKIVTAVRSKNGLECELKIPNLEIESMYRNTIEKWLAGNRTSNWYNTFLESLLQGRIEEFARYLQDVLINIVSFYDPAKKPELFYHGLLLGILASLDQSKYEIISNQESGYGRFDIVVIAKDPSQFSIILELKHVEIPKNKIRKDDSKVLATLLLKAAKVAYAQIESAKYMTIFKKRGIVKILKLGIAFAGKDLRIYSLEQEMSISVQK